MRFDCIDFLFWCLGALAVGMIIMLILSGANAQKPCEEYHVIDYEHGNVPMKCVSE